MTDNEIREQIDKLDLKKAVRESKKIMKNFTIYIASYVSESRGQISHITKEEYEKINKQRFIGSKHEDTFFKDLPDDNYVDVKTYKLTEENFAMAFHPMVWNVLTIEEKIAVCRIARQKTEGVDFKEFCKYKSNGVIMVGKNYGGSLNVGSFFYENLIGSDFLRYICNAENTIKNSYYINKHLNNQEDLSILDFESFEEMQYVSPLEPINNNFDELSPSQKATVLDQIYPRRLRSATIKAYDLIIEQAEPLLGIFPNFDSFITKDQKDLINTDVFVAQQLGTNKIERDKKYLDIKVTIFNNYFIQKRNKLAEEHNKLLEKYNNDANFMEREDLSEEMDKLHNQIEKYDAKRITFEQAKEHFAKHFNKKTKNQNIKTAKKSQQESYDINLN